MANILANLEPKDVFSYFEKICEIPHPSYKEKQISDYLVSFAKERNLEYYQDDLYNVIILKEATAGYENAAPIILQGHMDMVCEQEADCTKDMDKEGLDLLVEGDFISAEGTTLGGDDGIAVAMALAILDSKDIPHPKLEVVITVSEEVGMEGATGIDVSMLEGKKLLNLDSEEEGYFLAGCAGGAVVTLTKDLQLSIVKEDQEMLEIVIDGLQGGHSGAEIDKGRGNANVILGRILYEAYQKVPFSFVSMEGGSKDNAITRESYGKVATTDVAGLQQVMNDIATVICEEYQEVDPELKIQIRKVSKEDTDKIASEEMTKNVVTFLHELPYGVIAMCKDMPKLVETSLNLGIVTTTDELKLCYCVRSSVEEAFDELVGSLEQIAKKYEGTYSIKGRYPAWEFAKESPLREEMAKIYQEMFGSDPVVDVMHAGVECGQLAKKIPGLDCVSIGPDMYDIHTPKERLSISSTKRTYEFVLEILKRAK